MSQPRPSLGIFKFSSCTRFEITYFLEASSRVEPGPWDIALVEGSIGTLADAERVRALRERAGLLITIGACATAGGIQSLRNSADVQEWKEHVYPHPEWIETLATSTPIAEHVKVDYAIHGCPVNTEQVARVLARALLGTTPDLPSGSVCLECKRRGHTCVLVTRGVACMGPVTSEGCGAICPSMGRDCYACFGPAADPNPEALMQRFTELGLSRVEVLRRLRGITGYRPEFRQVAERLEAGDG
jgi:coenzyme F420-reducing hydrogenase gamma subunit